MTLKASELTCVCGEGVEERGLGAGAPQPHGAIAGAGQELHLGAVYGQAPHRVRVGHQRVGQHAPVCTQSPQVTLPLLHNKYTLSSVFIIIIMTI